MREYLAQHILHALVAAGVIEALLRAWRLTHPAERLAFRLLALTLPLAVLPVFWLFAPGRVNPSFAESYALFASVHWAAVRVGGVGLDGVLFVAACGLGVLLYLRDLTPLLQGHRRCEAPAVEAAAGDPLACAVSELSWRTGLRAAPRVLMIEDAAPVLFAAGVRRPALVVSRGTIARLDEAELRATLAHELAHLGYGDVLLGWVVMAARTLMLFNPIAQLVARAVVVEVERRADDTAAAVLEAPGVLADGMERLVGARLRDPIAGAPARASGLNGYVLGLATKGRAAALARRCRRLRDEWPPARRGLPGLRVGLTGVALAALLFFVV